MKAEAGPDWPTAERRFASPLTIGVLSDTHVHQRSHRRVPDEVCDLFRRFSCGLIVHLGDVNVGEVLDELAKIAPVIAVVGNNDDAELAAALPEEAWFDVGDLRFLALHGHLGTGSARALARTFAGQARVILYGHSHEPVIEREGETVIFNPGSPTDRRWHEHFGVGLIHVDGDTVTPELVLFDDPEHLVNVVP